MAAKRKTKRKPVSQAQARLYGVVARRGAGSARKLKRSEMSRPQAKGALRGAVVSALPERKRSTTTKPKPKPTPTPRAKPTRTPAQRAATRKRNARRAAGY